MHAEFHAPIFFSLMRNP